MNNRWILTVSCVKVCGSKIALYLRSIFNNAVADALNRMAQTGFRHRASGFLLEEVFFASPPNPPLDLPFRYPPKPTSQKNTLSITATLRRKNWDSQNGF